MSRPSRCSFSTQATSASRAERTTSIKSSESTSLAPVAARSAWVRWVHSRLASGTSVSRSRARPVSRSAVSGRSSNRSCASRA